MAELVGRLHPLRVPLKSPFVTGAASIRHRSGYLVSLSAHGVTGWGEASPLPGWSENTLVEVQAALSKAVEELREHGAPALDGLTDKLSDTPEARAGFFGAWADLQARIAARPLASHLVDALALSEAGRSGLGDSWGLKAFGETAASARILNALRAKPFSACADGSSERSGFVGTAAIPDPRAGQSAPALSEPPRRDAVRAVAVNALIGAGSVFETQQAARRAVSAGFKSVKLKVGHAAPAEDLERVAAVRRVLGSQVELRLDANGAWDEATAVEVLSRAEDCDIAFCEEPVAGLEPIAGLMGRVRVRLAVDESIRTLADAARALSLGVPVLIVKPQALGGADVALAITESARNAGAETVVTSFLDSAVGLSHALHTAAAADSATVPSSQGEPASSAASTRSPAAGRAHGLATATLLQQDAETPRIVGGEMSVPDSPGIGIDPVAPALTGARRPHGARRI